MMMNWNRMAELNRFPERKVISGEAHLRANIQNGFSSAKTEIERNEWAKLAIWSFSKEAGWKRPWREWPKKWKPKPAPSESPKEELR